MAVESPVKTYACPLRGAALRLLTCIHGMEARGSNAAREVIGRDGRPERRRHYPRRELRFGDSGWRAFYHCHGAPARPEAEQGHFHIFVHDPDACGDDTGWSHVAGLSVSGEGQPLRWFAVNRWVVGGTWVNAERMTTLLDELPSGVLSPVEEWIVSLLGLYQYEVTDLLLSRDRHLSRAAPRSTPAQRIEDRHLYNLGARPVDLETKLQCALARGRSSTGRRARMAR